MATGAPLVVFADIDGLLSTAGAAAVGTGLAAFEAIGDKVAVVLCSGRTRPEIEHLSQRLRVGHPFICEHGAAAFVPQGYFPFEVPNSVPAGNYEVVEFGRSAASVIEVLRRTAERQGVRLRCFSAMSVEEVAHDCGMSLLAARLAKLRDYGELFRLEDESVEARARFLEALHAAHLRCVPGARYDHAGASVDISIGIGLLRTLYRRWHGPTITVGVADWQADGDVLQLVECPLVIEPPGAEAPRRTGRRMAAPRAIRLDGGASWAAPIAAVVRELYPQVQAPLAAN